MPATPILARRSPVPAKSAPESFAAAARRRRSSAPLNPRRDAPHVHQARVAGVRVTLAVPLASPERATEGLDLGLGQPLFPHCSEAPTRHALFALSGRHQVSAPNALMGYPFGPCWSDQPAGPRLAWRQARLPAGYPPVFDTGPGVDTDPYRKTRKIPLDPCPKIPHIPRLSVTARGPAHGGDP
jgi:hypothetical protein